MSLALCIPDLLANGEIDARQADEMLALFGSLRSEYRKAMGDEAADAIASTRALEQLATQKAQRKRVALLQVQGQRTAWLDMTAYGRGAGGVRAIDEAAPDRLAKAAEALLVRSEYAPYQNVEYLWKSIRGQAHATMSGVLQKHSRDLLGRVRNKAELDDMVRELFNPGSSGNVSARELADAWREASEALRQRYNAAGGHIGKLENWGLPQSWDPDAVAAAGFDQWRGDMVATLDRSKMIDGATGAPFSDAALDAALRDVFDTISTDGWAHRDPGGQGGGSSLANRRADHRFLTFADADSWTAMQAKYGGGASPFDTMMAHIDAMSRDIALMERLGPNPAQALKWLGDTIEKDANLRAAEGGAGSKKRRDAAFAARSNLQRLYDEISGANRRPENRRLALGFSTLRSWQVATKLGSAVLSTTSDQATQLLARQMNGIPVASQIWSQLKLLNPGAVEDRALAMRMGLIAEEASKMGASTARMTGEELTGEWAQRLAEGTMRVSGLGAITQGGRWAFGMDFLSHITGERGKAFDRLDAPFRNAFERYGLSSADWDRIRATPLTEARGADWILPEAIGDQGLRDRMMRMIMTETDFAVPVPGIAIGAMVNGALPKGTLIGEVGRTAFQFKSFAVGLTMMQMQRAMAMTGWSRATYAAQMFLYTTIMGAAALQLKEIAKGRDPRPIYDSKDPGATAAFWGASVLQGGGAGIYGDFLRSSQSRFGGGIGSVLAGPAFATADAALGLVVGQPLKAIQGEKTNPGAAAVKLLKSETPGVGSLWFTRLAFERLVLDQAAREVDPQYRERFKRLEHYAAEQGQDYFWSPGDHLEEARAPDVGNLVE
ncbi:hypothetical protein [Sphingopyxis granuli]|uniref:hypothetical protein n=1 Tax=Sphingopyxis granuli TaxID=267128 RepID=UPI001BAF7D7B|nr:hypothetical protein [Sphingopyxis granuli]QUM73349.1 hypothetical protein ICN83_05535 [Sphingopyxis granuli]